MRHFIKKFPVWTSGTMLALLLGPASVLASGAAPCDEPSAAPMEPVAVEYERRMRIIEALEVTKDDQRLSCLVQADTDLASYYVVLRRVSASLQDPQLVDKVLNLPALDKEKKNYKKAVSDVFSGIAASGDGVKPEIAASLLEAFKDDQEEKDAALRSILASSAMPAGLRDPDLGMTTQLITAGANVEKSVAEIREQISSVQAAGAHSAVRYDLDRLNKFHARLISPR